LYISQGELNDLLIFNIELNLLNVNALHDVGADNSNLKNVCGFSLLTMVCAWVGVECGNCLPHSLPNKDFIGTSRDKT